MRVRELYEKEGGPGAETLLNLDWSYKNPLHPALEEIAKEINGRDLTTGKQLSTFGELKDDGTTSSGNWLYCGSFTEAGNQMARRDPRDPSGMGRYEGWAWNWPANRRVLYNRANSDGQGKAWDPSRPGIVWDGDKWVGDVPDMKPDAKPGTYDAFFMLPEGRRQALAPDFSRRPLPRALRGAGASRRESAAPGRTPPNPGRTRVHERARPGVRRSEGI
jgi:formate dehydrogenase major subunit